MLEVSYEYWNVLSHQLILVSSLLSGFSIAVVANLLVYKSNSRITINILKAATVAAGSFLATVFAMTKIFMMTTEGYPLKMVENDLRLPQIVGALTFFIGLISISALISLAGWTKSRSTGIFTTIVGILTFLIILIMLA